MTDKANDVQIIPQSNFLAAKIGKDGPDPETMFARAEAAVAKLQDDYAAWADQDIDNLCAVLEVAKASAAERPQNLRKVFDIVHDMRGQGGTFGYTLVTEVGNSLCRYLETLEDAGEREMEVVEAHADALRTVIRQKVKGDGGHLGREIVDGLHQAVEKVTG